MRTDKGTLQELRHNLRQCARCEWICCATSPYDDDSSCEYLWNLNHLSSLKIDLTSPQPPAKLEEKLLPNLSILLARQSDRFRWFCHINFLMIFDMHCHWMATQNSLLCSLNCLSEIFDATQVKSFFFCWTLLAASFITFLIATKFVSCKSINILWNRNGAEKEETTTGKDGKRKASAYSDVPNDMFYCHLCAKHMWDSTSFENHLKGRTHQVTSTTFTLFLNQLKCELFF